jgi:hypothetical protein
VGVPPPFGKYFLRKKYPVGPETGVVVPDGGPEHVSVDPFPLDAHQKHCPFGKPTS